MKAYSLLVLVAMMFNSASHAGTSFEQKLNIGCYKKVYCVEAIPQGSGARIMFEALQNYPITVVLTGDVASLKPSKPLPIRLQVKPGSKVEVFRVESWSASDINKLSINLKWGLAGATFSDEAINLPFDGRNSYRVTQGYNGRGSHRGSQQHAIDFGMTEGTPVQAARDGVVVMVEQNYSQTTIVDEDRDEVNQIWILHTDGTLSTYMHLRYKSAKVSEGDLVRAGQVIAESGMTGSAKTPHLHFEVFKPLANSQRRQSLAVRYRLPSGKIIEPPEAGATVP